MSGEVAWPVTDAMRDAAVAHLRTLVAAGRLELEEFSSSVDLIMAARDREQLELALRTVPAGVRITPYGRRIHEPLVHTVKSGRLQLTSGWQLAADTRVSVESGRATLDLGGAEFDDVAVTLDLTAQSGSITVIVPPGVNVQIIEATSASGRVDNRVPGLPSLPGMPVVRVRARVNSGRIVLEPPRRPRVRSWWMFWRRRPALARAF